MEDTLRIIHFNDVYNIEAGVSEPVGGAARFLTAVNSLRDRDTLVLFSGDIFNPSLQSNFFRGEHMIPVLNRLEVHVAVLGNHDLDFGLDACMRLTADTSFPWLMSNVLNKETGRPLAEGKVTFITRWRGVKVGFMGLVEKDWLESLSTINPDEVEYIHFVQMGRTLSAKLRDLGCELVVALTHMRTPNDLKLLQEVPGIDLILGGHDHDYEVHRQEHRLLVKSGTDFREFSVLELRRQGEGLWRADVEKIKVTSQFEENAQLKRELEPFVDTVESRLNDVIARFEVDLEGRFNKMRTEETNLGNFCADVMLAATNADCAILNSGTLRSDCIHPRGDFTMRDLLKVAPFRDCLVVLEVPGAVLHQALENAVSQHPLCAGRFLQVAGLSFVFDPSKEPFSRVDIGHVKVGDEFLSPTRDYRVCTKEYVYTGKDGFTCMSSCRLLQGTETCINFCTMIQNHFDSVRRLRGELGAQAAASTHRQSVVAVSRRDSRFRAVTSASTTASRGGLRRRLLDRQQLSSQEVSEQRTDIRSRNTDSIALTRSEAVRLAPRVEGRILLATPEVVGLLDDERRLALSAI